MSYHVCYDQDRVVRALVFRVGEVCRDCGFFLESFCICEGKGEGRVGDLRREKGPYYRQYFCSRPQRCLHA
jgi:hypothetical protein